MTSTDRLRPASLRRFRVAALFLLALPVLLVATPAAAQAPPPDYSGTWSLSTTAELPDDGGTCIFEGTAQVTQDGTDLAGTANLSLINGPPDCPPAMMADLDGEVEDDGCIELGLLLGGNFGEASFTGCPGEAADTLVGSFQVTSGPFEGGGGTWTAVIGASVLAIPTLSALGLAALVVLLMLTGAWIARRRTGAALLFSAVALLLLPAVGLAGEEEVEPAADATAYDLPTDVVTVKSTPEVGLEPREKIDLSLRDADLVEVLRSFAIMGDFNLVVHPDVEGSVTVELKQVEWEKALAMILRLNGLSAEVDGRLWAVREQADR